MWKVLMYLDWKLQTNFNIAGRMMTTKAALTDRTVERTIMRRRCQATELPLSLSRRSEGRLVVGVGGWGMQCEEVGRYDSRANSRRPTSKNNGPPWQY